MVLNFKNYEWRGCARCCSTGDIGFCIAVARSHGPYARTKVISLPGGDAFTFWEKYLHTDLRTVWLGHGAHCHHTDESHPFDTAHCPNNREKDCWQCLYILQVMKSVRDGDILVACTTNISRLSGGEDEDGVSTIDFEKKYGPGSSELPGETFQREKPESWGQGHFSNGHWDLKGCQRECPLNRSTGKPLGLGCRWERKFLDSLPEEVFVLPQVPVAKELVGPALLVATLLFAGCMMLVDLLITVALPAHRVLRVPVHGLLWLALSLSIMHHSLALTLCSSRLRGCWGHGLTLVACAFHFLATLLDMLRGVESNSSTTTTATPQSEGAKELEIAPMNFMVTIVAMLASFMASAVLSCLSYCGCCQPGQMAPLREDPSYLARGQGTEDPSRPLMKNA